MTKQPTPGLYESTAEEVEKVETLGRSTIDAWLQENCGKGIPFRDATDQESMLHGLAYILRQIEGTDRYLVNIGQVGPATSALRLALDHFARCALQKKEATE